MFNLFLPSELIHDYILSQRPSLHRRQPNSFSKEYSLESASSRFLLGCRGKGCVCATDMLVEEGNRSSLLEEFNVGRTPRYQVVSRIFLLDSEMLADDDSEWRDGKLLKRIYLSDHQCSVGLEVAGETEAVVVVYSRRQFEQSVLIDVKRGHFSSVIDVIGNSLHTHEAFKRLKGGTVDDDEFNGVVQLLHSISRKSIHFFTELKSHSSKLLPTLPSTPIIQPPSMLGEVHTRIHHLSTTTLPHHNKLHQHLFIDLLWKSFIDCLFGILILVILLTYVDFQALAHSLVSYAEWVGSELEGLLGWLEGAPAGLKLNKPLAVLLSAFFKHHVMLWQAYLNLLQPLWGSILKTASLSGVFGVSMQLSITLDLLSATTPHVYCFYVYAARLYYFQLKALRNLWRLFRGKRWNTKDGRVEDGQFRIDVMFISTLSFTIILFLLPTTSLFYAVFTCLRICTLVVHLLVGMVINCMHRNPSYWLLLSIFRPIKLAGRVEMRLMEDCRGKVVSLQLVKPSIREILSLSSTQRVHSTQGSSSPPSSSSAPSSSAPPPSSSSPPQATRSLFSKLLVGELIFPWVEKNS